MFTKLSNSWNLMKASWAVLREDKELIIFPILSTVAVILVTISFAVPMFFAGFFDKGVLNDSGILKYVVGFVFYFVQYTIIIFSNTALVGAAMIRLRGGNPTVSDGFKIAFGHITTILGYAFISATVGLVTGFITLALVITMVLTMVALAEVLTTGMLIFVISLFVLSFILLALISSTLSSIYEAAVYIYAAEGKTTGFFEERLVSEAFRLK